MLKLSHSWPVGAPLSWHLFYMSSSFFEPFHTFWHKIFQAHLLLSLPQPWKQLFLQRTLVPFSGESQDLDTGCSHCCKAYHYIPRPSQWTDLEYIHIHLLLFFTYLYNILKVLSSHQHLQFQSTTTNTLSIFVISFYEVKHLPTFILNIFTHVNDP